jgi:hypothetical protein
MQVAHKAAEVQAHVLFFLLYLLALVPLGFLNPAGRRALTGRPPGGPGWRTRESNSSDLTASRRQY